jgi:hypothetical protein
VAISEVHKQVELMNARHAEGLEVLQKEHLTQISAMQTQAEAAESHAMTCSKNFNVLVESHTQELKSKEREIEGVHAELRKVEDSIKLLCADILGELLFAKTPFAPLSLLLDFSYVTFL